MIVKGASGDNIGLAAFGHPGQGGAACFAKARGKMACLRHFITTDIFFALEPGEMFWCNDDIGGMSAARDFAAS